MRMWSVVIVVIAACGGSDEKSSVWMPGATTYPSASTTVANEESSDEGDDDDESSSGASPMPSDDEGGEPPPTPSDDDGGEPPGTTSGAVTSAGETTTGNDSLDHCLEEAATSCEECACNSCLPQLMACQEDPGCVAIRMCAQESGCTGIECLGPCGEVIDANGGPFGPSAGLASMVSSCYTDACDGC
ncbi:MAG TPA: hypothetical protein VG755_40330 [Nannocystaceae bacterium]|nr:hypothetical protein [Nannocystaceae bacterium]